MSILASLRAPDRVDSWTNLLTGLGSGPSRTRTRTRPRLRLDDVTLEMIFAATASARASATACRYALRRVRGRAPARPRRRARSPAKLDAFGVLPRFVEAWTWARAFGGAVVWIGVEPTGSTPRCRSTPRACATSAS
jgi:hypothetical protein